MLVKADWKEYDEEMTAPPDEAEAEMDEATQGWLNRRNFVAAFERLWHYLSTTSALHKRLAIILLGETPSAAAKGVFDAQVADLGRSHSLKAVAIFEQLDREEKKHVLLDEVMSTSSSEEADKWLALALEQIKYDERLPVLPQRTDPSALRATAGKTGGEVVVVVAAYAPQVKGVDSPHLPTDARGHVKAASFAWYELVCADYLRCCGLGFLVGESGRLPLLGGVADLVLDAYPGVTPVGIGKGERVDAEKLCRNACADPPLRAAAGDYLVARLHRMKREGFDRVGL